MWLIPHKRLCLKNRNVLRKKLTFMNFSHIKLNFVGNLTQRLVFLKSQSFAIKIKFYDFFNMKIEILCHINALFSQNRKVLRIKLTFMNFSQRLDFLKSQNFVIKIKFYDFFNMKIGILCVMVCFHKIAKFCE